MKFPFLFHDGSNELFRKIEEVIEENILLKVENDLPMIISYDIMKNDIIQNDDNSHIKIEEPVEMMMLSLTNPAHALGEFTCFLEYYTSKETKLKVCINSIIINKMPYLYQFIKLFLTEDQIITIDAYKIYHFNYVIMRRNIHFVHGINVQFLPIKINNNILVLNDLQHIKYEVNCEKILNKSEEIYNNHKHKYTLSDNIMIIKTSKEKYTVSLHRSLEYPEPDVLNLLEKNNIQFLEISMFEDIYEYICRIYHAKNIIFSYGGPMCTNRFFCNPHANIIVLGNLHYKNEYHCDANFYWHIRAAMLAPVQRQTFMLDFENRLTIDNTKSIISLLDFI